jgi:methyltransferase family protein
MARRALAALTQLPTKVNVPLRHRGFIALSFLSLLVISRSVALASEDQPKSGQLGKDVVWVPSPTVMVEKLLNMAQVTRQDYVIDLGSGDGRSVIAAAKRGARAHGIEYDAGLVAVSKREAAKSGLSDKATFQQGDVFASDFSNATVIFLFLTPEMNIRLRPRLLDLKPGTRIVANTFGIGDWNADETSMIADNCERFCTARLWIVPARVAGTWQMGERKMSLKQNYQTFSGVLKAANGITPIAGRLRGERIFFGGSKTQFTGRVAGQVIDGIERTEGKDRPFKATRTGN